MADLYNSDLGRNALKSRETTQFGTRKLAFYTFTCPPEFLNIVVGYDQPNSPYSQIVRALQEANVELFWLGQPHNNEDSFFSNWSGLIPSDSNSFMFAIKDDADSPNIFQTGSPSYDVLGANQDGYDNYIKLDTNYYPNIGQPVSFNMTDDGVTAGKTYYVHDYDQNNGALYIQLSETVTQENNDNTPDYPKGVGHPGPVFMLNPAPSSNGYTATFRELETDWAGTAGDYQPSCCWNPDAKFILAYRLSDHVYNAIGPGPWSIIRCQDTFGIFPLTCAIGY